MMVRHGPFDFFFFGGGGGGQKNPFTFSELEKACSYTEKKKLIHTNNLLNLFHGYNFGVFKFYHFEY